MLALLAALVAGPAQAGCRLALLLALDISSSVDDAEDRLQRDGLAAALLSPEVQAALLATPEAPVALAVYQWSGRQQQQTVLGWTLLSGPDAVLGAARAIRDSRRSDTDFPTAMGYALGHAATLFRAAPDCLFRTIDISGDGVNNDGFGPALAYRNFPLGGVTVNGLAVGGAAQNDAELIAFYRNHVIRGPGAFVETAVDFQDFERAMRRKLEREVGSRIVGRAAPGGG
ncbi:DUF1194 domain-containing protein [Actibacterium sp. D379-3]